MPDFRLSVRLYSPDIQVSRHLYIIMTTLFVSKGNPTSQGTYLIRLKTETDFPLTIVTAPQSLVISTLLPLFFSRSSVSGDGCPYVFVAEQETAASSGLTISRNSAPVEYLEP